MQFNRRWLLPSLAVLLTVTAGCASDSRWQRGRFERIQAEARAQNKLTFVYFRAWHSVQCTHFEDEVLAQIPVRNATADMVCVRYEHDVAAARRLAQSWGITRVPAYAILDPSGTLLVAESGEISADSLLAELARARRSIAPSVQPTSSSP